MQNVEVLLIRIKAGLDPFKTRVFSQIMFHCMFNDKAGIMEPQGVCREPLLVFIKILGLVEDTPLSILGQFVGALEDLPHSPGMFICRWILPKQVLRVILG